MGESGISVAKRLLDLNYVITKKYTPKRWEDEMKGIAKGSGVPVRTWRRLSLIP